MGDTQSTRKSTTEEILKLFEDEVKKWDVTISNLKETLKEESSNWVPVYLRSQMEETEAKWATIKSLIPSRKQPGGQTTGHSTTQLQICCEEVRRGAEAELKQLKANNKTLFSNIQTAEQELTEKRKIIEKLQEKQKESSSEDVKASSIKTNVGNDLQTDNKDVEDRQQLVCENCSTKVNNIDSLRKKGMSKEATFEKETVELKRQIGKLNTEKKDQQERINHLDHHTEELLREKEISEKIIKRETEAADEQKDETPQKIKGQQSPKDHVVQKLQKQKEEMAEKFQVEKLKLMEEGQMLTAQKESLVCQVGKLEKEKEALLLRLSKVAGDRLTKNNSAITDLSDPNRPTKLGEVYSEIYDNEWTDAFEALKVAGHEDYAAIETLRLTLQHVMQFCESNADLLIKRSSDAVNLLFEEYQKPASDMKKTPQLTMPASQAREVRKLLRQKSSIEDIWFQQRWKPKRSSNDKERKVKESTAEGQNGGKSNVDVDSKLKQVRREMATYMVPVVQKAFMDANWSNEYIDGLKPFILKCVFIAWMLIVQSPPMSLHKCEKDTKFDKTLYKEYTASGPLVDYVVWPALLLNEDGPVVCKGVAEGKAGVMRSISQN